MGLEVERVWGMGVERYFSGGGFWGLGLGFTVAGTSRCRQLYSSI